MSLGVRRAVFLLAAGGVGALMLFGVRGLPPFGHYRGPYGDVLNRVAPSERHTTEVVGAVTFDYRGFDTMGEEFILFAAVTGVSLLLRASREEEAEIDRKEIAEERIHPRVTDAVRVLGLGLIGPSIVLGLYVIAHGYVTPGGGFQGGVIVSGAVVLLFLAGSYLPFRRVNPIPLIDLAGGAGAGTYVVVGLFGLVAGGAFLANVLPLGRAGTLLSAGIIPLINWGVGLEVIAGFLLVLSEFLDQTLVIHRRGSS